MTLKANWFQTSVSPLVDARDERRLLRALRPSGGVVLSGDLAVTAVGAGTTLNVSVAACGQGGGAVIPGLDTHQGAYFAYNDAALQVPVAVADPTNPRIDTVILRIYDDEVAPGSGFAVAVELARGAPNANPVPPILPRDCIPLADVRVNASATGIGAGNITDRRVTLHGGSLPTGVIVSDGSTQTIGAGSNQPLPIRQVVQGPASWLSSPTVTIPPNAGGLYLINLWVWGRSDAIAYIPSELRTVAGVAYAPQMIVGGVVNPSTGQQNLQGSWVRQCLGGDTFRVYYYGNALTAPNWLGVARFSFLRLGDGLAA